MKKKDFILSYKWQEKRDKEYDNYLEDFIVEEKGILIEFSILSNIDKDDYDIEGIYDKVFLNNFNVSFISNLPIEIKKLFSILRQQKFNCDKINFCFMSNKNNYLFFIKGLKLDYSINNKILCFNFAEDRPIILKIRKIETVKIKRNLLFSWWDYSDIELKKFFKDKEISFLGNIQYALILCRKELKLKFP